MARCTSWRYTPLAGHSGHMPGKCRSCWAPCTEKIDERGGRCQACLQAILASPDHRIRRCLLDEPDLTEDVLELLAQDQYPLISFGAQQRLDGLSLSSAGADSDLDTDTGADDIAQDHSPPWGDLLADSTTPVSPPVPNQDSEMEDSVKSEPPP